MAENSAIQELTPETAGGWELRRMSQRHFRMIELVLAGMSNVDVASALGITPQSVSLCTKSPLFQHHLSLRREQQNRKTDAGIIQQNASAAEIINDSAADAAMVMRDTLYDDDAKNRIAASKDILDRAGIGMKANQTPLIQITTDRMELLVVALRESKGLGCQNTPETLPAG